MLCAYLGQLARVRDALADLVAVVIDERDQAELADREADQEAHSTDDIHVEHVKVARRVRKKTWSYLIPKLFTRCSGSPPNS